MGEDFCDMGADDQPPDDAAAEAEDLQTGGDGESANEPLIKKDPASKALAKGQAVVYGEDDGLDFESNMSKLMLPIVLVFLGIGWIGFIDKFEFLRYMLIKLDKVDGETFDKMIAIFDKLDADGGGTLGEEDFLTTGAQHEQASDLHTNPNLTK